MKSGISFTNASGTAGVFRRDRYPDQGSGPSGEPGIFERNENFEGIKVIRN